jgi:chorismate mutase
VSEYDSDEALAQAMMSVLEDLIRQYPEQYVWLYKRWRYIPLDAPAEIAGKYPGYARVYEEGTGRWTES